MARSWPGRHLVPVALAATVLLLVGGAWAYWAAAGSSRVMAAELAADHVKCLIMNAALGTRQSADMVEASMAADFDWDVHLPDGGEAQGLELVGSRRCLYLGGTIAHLMYRHQGQPVSVFMLPGTAYGDGFVEVLGHKCAIWSGGGRTFALVSEGTNADVEGLVTFAQATFH